MSKSIELQLKELIEASVAQTKALSDKIDAQASDSNTYTERMKKMEDNLANAMKTVVGMDSSMKEFNKMVEGKLSELEKKYAGVNISVQDGEEEDEEEEDGEMNKEEEDKEEEMKKEEASEAKCKPKAAEMPAPEETENTKDSENKIEGVNEQVVVTKKKKKAKGKANEVEKIDEAANAEYEKSASTEEVTAPVAQEVKQEAKQEDSSVEKLAQALQSKIDSAIEKVASVTSMSNASTELSEKLAQEVKAKEDAIRHFKALEEKFETLMAKVSKLETTEKTVEAKAAQIVASTGVDAVAVSVESAQVPEQASDSDVFKKFESLNGAEQRKYYIENRAIIERHASALLRAGKRS